MLLRIVCVAVAPYKTKALPKAETVVLVTVPPKETNSVPPLTVRRWRTVHVLNAARADEGGAGERAGRDVLRAAELDVLLTAVRRRCSAGADALISVTLAVPPNRFWVPAVGRSRRAVGAAEKTFSTPPFWTSLSIARPPADTFWMPPLTKVPLAVPRRPHACRRCRSSCRVEAPWRDLVPPLDTIEKSAVPPLRTNLTAVTAMISALSCCRSRQLEDRAAAEGDAACRIARSRLRGCRPSRP